MSRRNELILVPIVSLPFEEVTYIVARDGRSDCLVIDPGLEPGRILSELGTRGLEPAVILNTHGHVDHIAGNAAVKQAFPAAPLIIGERDEAMLADPMRNLSGLAGLRVTSPPADRLVREGDVVEAAGFRLDVLDIPGHSPGHVVYVWSDASPAIVFGGDVLFAGSVGRTDLPGGDHRLLVSGIRTKLFAMPDETTVYPGHGPATTVGEERRTNPFVGLGA
jgi:hydroxyacylglutathione hydrolase